ncbi:MAG: glycosyltransferase family 2 protein [Oligosphaeraceae bacterium]|nr:glycosyltransferase family 2 protein [Oligosphaeraceae bacterium]
MSASWHKYLRRAVLLPSEPAPGLQLGQFRHVVVVPVMDELQFLPRTLSSLAQALPDRVAVLLVINHGPDAAPARKQNNLTLLAQLRQGETWGVPARQLFWIDCARPGRELNRGVGEARKIGLDAGLASLAPDSLGESFLVCLDADTLVSARYWPAIEEGFRQHPRCGALSLGFRHQKGGSAAEECTIRQYEAYMARYLEGLRLAGSRYAYHSIGSAIAVRAGSYLAAGGMRMPPAGEDFYFLQAVCKTAAVVQLDEPVVFPSARVSDRVLFGTGPMQQKLQQGEALPCLPAAAFAALREMLALTTGELLSHPEEFADKLAPAARQFLERRGFFAVWPKILLNTAREPHALRTAFDCWFDALKTYQFLRENAEGDAAAENFPPAAAGTPGRG